MLNKKLKSQAVMEYMILFAIVVLGVLLVAMYFPKIDREIENDEIETFGLMLSEEVNNIKIQGEGNFKRIQTDIPERIDDFYYSNGNLIIFLESKEVQKRYFPVNVPIIGEITYGAIYAEYFSNETVDYVCLYPDGDRQKCCIDFMCNMDSLE